MTTSVRRTHTCVPLKFQCEISKSSKTSRTAKESAIASGFSTKNIRPLLCTWVAVAPERPLAFSAEMAEKRLRSSPTGNTPRQPSKRLSLRSRVLTFTEDSDSGSHSESPATRAVLPRTSLGGTWSDEENKALLTFLLLNRPEDSWPATKNRGFWSSAAEFVQQVGKGTVRRSGK